MNETILQALMKLFALVAYVNKSGEPNIERDVLYEYLQRQFSNELVEKYLILFNDYLEDYHPKLPDVFDFDAFERELIGSDIVSELCVHLNTELQQEQKIITMVYLLDFIGSGSQLSEYQIKLIEKVCDNLNIPKEEYLDTRFFTFNQTEKLINKQNLLVVSSEIGSEPEQQSNKQLYIDKLEGQIVVIQVPSTKTLIFRYYGNQELYLNGYYIKANRSYIWAPGSVIKNSKIGSIYYIWILGQYIKASHSKFVFTANDIEYSYGNSPNGLKRFSLNEESGRLIGIIGGSGSGKSTLLKVLSGILKTQNGSIEINGYDIHKNKEILEGLIGYVPQDDFLIKELTVFENLFFAAQFSFSKFTNREITKIIEQALLDFDLVEARDLRVGDAFSTFLSGGQRKRLNIALELIREPAVLFVDEPTSGLSSSDSEKVMNLLKRQTYKGRLVFANIHQPSSEIFKLLDKILVVDQGGRVVYYGNPIDAIGYLKNISHSVDADNNECRCCGNINSDQILRNLEARVVDVNGRLTRKRKTSPEEWHNLYMELIHPIIRSIKRSYATEIPENKYEIPSRWQQLKLYFKRDLLAKLKNRQYLFITLMESPVLAFLLAFYTRSSREPNGSVTSYFFGLNNNIPAFLFMAVIVALFLGMVVSAEEIYRDRKLLERERFLNLSRSSYLFSKTFILFSISAIQVLLFVLIGDYILEIQGMAWRYFIILFTAAAWANIIGLNISSGFKSVVTIYVLVPLILVPQLLFSGVVVNFYDLNRSIQSYKNVPFVGNAMTSRWAYESIVITQFRDNQFEKHFFETDMQLSDALYNKAYLIPELKKQLNIVNENFDNTAMDSIVKNSLSLLRNELTNLENKQNENIDNLIKELTVDGYNSTIYESLLSYLDESWAEYHNHYLNAQKKQNGICDELIREKGSREEFLKFKKQYYNNQLANIVKNEKELINYFIADNNIIRLKDPVFTLPLHNGKAHFYAPYKKLFNIYLDTFWYNILRIWLTITIWFVILYFDIILKILKYIEGIRLRRFSRRMIKILGRVNETRRNR